MRLLTALEKLPPPNHRRFKRWAEEQPALVGLDYASLRAALLDDREPVNYDRKDELLVALVRLARTDDEAGRALLMCLLPGIKAKLRAHAYGLDPDEPASIIVTALWQRIRRYPLDRRPRRIAVNLLLDAASDLIRDRDAERAWQDYARLTDRDIDVPQALPGWSADLMWHVVLRHRVLTRREVALVDATRLRGLPLRDVARLLGMNHEAAKKARRRAELKLAAHWRTGHRAPAA
jgi:hypothetical protein